MERKIQTDLKGADYNEKLIAKFEGIEIDSICHHGNSPQNNPINSTKDWDIYQLIDGTDAKKANQLALKALNNGATALCIENPNDLPLLFKDILIEHIRVDFKIIQPTHLQSLKNLLTTENYIKNLCKVPFMEMKADHSLTFIIKALRQTEN